MSDVLRHLRNFLFARDPGVILQLILPLPNHVPQADFPVLICDPGSRIGRFEDLPEAKSGS